MQCASALQVVPPRGGVSRNRRNIRAHAGPRQAAAHDRASGASGAAPAAPALSAETLREAGKRVVAGLAAVLLALEPLALSAPPPASAALVNPNTRLPKNAEVALRRAIPVFNEPIRTAQAKMEEVGFLLRIPQRKPWGSMTTNIADARGILSTQRFAILEAVPEKDRAAAAEILDALSSRLEAVTAAAAAQDADRTAARMASALEQLGKLEILQAPGLPFLIPAAYADRPRLVGRATAEFVIARANGASFGAMSDGLGPQKTAKVEITLDGYNAPLTAGNAAALINLGYYNGAPLAAPPSSASVLAQPSKVSPLGYKELPLELRAQGEYEPRYRVPLDALGGGEMPVLPISVYGAVAALRGGDGGNDSSPGGFFFFLYDRRTSGLGGLSFDEGQFSVFGYVTAGEEVLSQLRTGDRIQSARLTSGKERLVIPPGRAKDAAEKAAAAEAALNEPQAEAPGAQQ